MADTFHLLTVAGLKDGQCIDSAIFKNERSLYKFIDTAFRLL